MKTRGSSSSLCFLGWWSIFIIAMQRKGEKGTDREKVYLTFTLHYKYIRLLLLWLLVLLIRKLWQQFNYYIFFRFQGWLADKHWITWMQDRAMRHKSVGHLIPIGLQGLPNSLLGTLSSGGGCVYTFGDVILIINWRPCKLHNIKSKTRHLLFGSNSISDCDCVTYAMAGFLLFLCVIPSILYE